VVSKNSELLLAIRLAVGDLAATIRIKPIRFFIQDPLFRSL
jgi:hypothetical protein